MRQPGVAIPVEIERRSERLFWRQLSMVVFIVLAFGDVVAYLVAGIVAAILFAVFATLVILKLVATHWVGQSFRELLSGSTPLN